MAQKPDADKTWANFKAHFLKAQEERKTKNPRQPTKPDTMLLPKPPWQPPLKLSQPCNDEQHQHQRFAKLTNQLSALTSKVEQLTTQNTELKATIQTLKSKPQHQQQSQSTAIATMEIIVGRMVTKLVTNTTVALPQPCTRTLQGSYPLQHYGW
jgi:hypothetical protein